MEVQTTANGAEQSQAIPKIEILSPEKTNLLLRRDVPAEVYQKFIEGVRAIEDGGGMYLRCDSEAEAALFKKKLREIAKAQRVKIRFTDEVRRKRDKDTKRFLDREDFNFTVAKPSSEQQKQTVGLHKGRK